MGIFEFIIIKKAASEETAFLNGFSEPTRINANKTRLPDAVLGQLDKALRRIAVNA